MRTDVWIDVCVTDEEGAVTKHTKRIDVERNRAYHIGEQVLFEVRLAETNHETMRGTDSL